MEPGQSQAVAGSSNLLLARPYTSEFRLARMAPKPPKSAVWHWGPFDWGHPD
jgi:hypothetical protein